MAIVRKWAGTAARPCSGPNQLRDTYDPELVVGPSNGLRQPRKSHYKGLDWRAVGSCFGGFSIKICTLQIFSDRLCIALTVYKVIFFFSCLFRCKRALASLSDPLVGVVFRYRFD